jgi:hypothetical protein
MELERLSWVWADELYQVFSDWLASVGQKPMAQRTFMGRLTGHSALPAYVAHEQVYSSREGVSRKPHGSWMSETPAPLPSRPKAVLGLRFDRS